MRDIVTVIGSLNYDIISRQERLPQIGETFINDSVSCTGGGKGANQAVQLAKLGVETYFVGAVGNDALGDYILDALTTYSVNVQYITRSATNTGIGIIQAFDQGKVMATVYPGANLSFSIEDIDRAEEIISKSKFVVLQLEVSQEVVDYACKMANKFGCIVVLNAAPARTLSDDLLSLVDFLIVNETEFSFYVGKDVTDFEAVEKEYKKIINKIKGKLIVTLGEKGSVFCSEDECKFIMAKKVNAIDTTGAGDSYIGTFVSCLLKELGYLEALQTATEASAITVQNIGAQNSMPTLKQLLEI